MKIGDKIVITKIKDEQLKFRLGELGIFEGSKVQYLGNDYFKTSTIIPLIFSGKGLIEYMYDKR